jgi:spore coat polysaccharide biosynthesis protein SpsF
VNVIKIVIGVQARSTSKRLPQKSIALVDTHTVTDHVISACLSAADHVNKQKTKVPIHAQVVLLVPTGDQLKGLFEDKVVVYEGPEDDVLTRYMLAVDSLKPDYIVRITGDCSLIPPSIISKHILCATFDRLDYCSNVAENCRTYIDGFDVEVISQELMRWVDTNAKSQQDREHVTTYVRSNGPSWAKVGTVIGYVDLSEIKLSVDTQDDLERVRANKKAINEKLNIAKQRGFVFRF